jgi:hypothetical protein
MMARSKGWKFEPARHSLASRGIKTRTTYADKLSQRAQEVSVDEQNKATSRREVQYFLEKSPSSYSGYVSIKDGEIHTWMGDKLGEILHKSQTSRRGFVGDPVYSVYFKGINGKIYHGYGSDQSLINFKERRKKVK